MRVQLYNKELVTLSSSSSVFSLILCEQKLGHYIYFIFLSYHYTSLQAWELNLPKLLIEGPRADTELEMRLHRGYIFGWGEMVLLDDNHIKPNTSLHTNAYRKAGLEVIQASAFHLHLGCRSNPVLIKTMLVTQTSRFLTASGDTHTHSSE